MDLLVDYFFSETVSGLSYKQILVDYACPQLQRKRLYFQHDGAASHYAIIVGEWIDKKFPGRWIGRRWSFDCPARSSDLTPCDFSLWAYLKNIVFNEPCTSMIQLQNRIQEGCASATKAMSRKVMSFGGSTSTWLFTKWRTLSFVRGPRKIKVILIYFSKNSLYSVCSVYSL